MHGPQLRMLACWIFFTEIKAKDEYVFKSYNKIYLKNHFFCKNSLMTVTATENSKLSGLKKCWQ